MLSRTVRRLAATLALLGVAFSALWPLVTHARPQPMGVPMVICVNGGMQLVHVDLGGTQRPSHEPREHCALCLGAIEPVAQAAPPAAILDIVAPSDTSPAIIADSPRTFLVERPPSQAPPFALAR